MARQLVDPVHIVYRVGRLAPSSSRPNGPWDGVVSNWSRPPPRDPVVPLGTAMYQPSGAVGRAGLQQDQEHLIKDSPLPAWHRPCSSHCGCGAPRLPAEEAVDYPHVNMLTPPTKGNRVSRTRMTRRPRVRKMQLFRALRLFLVRIALGALGRFVGCGLGHQL